MNTEQIERRVEKMTDHLDALLMRGALTQKDYDAAMRELNQWAEEKEREQKKVSMTGIKPRRVGGTLFVKLPAELQRVIEGGCQCRHCKAAPGKVPMWDTLAIAANAEGRTWTVHFPDLTS
jgi:hypothetical protein